MNGKRRFFISCIIISLFLLTGCWDNQNIESNIGLALDLADEQPGDIHVQGENPVITATIQNVDPKQSVGGDAQIDYKNTSITSNTLSKMIVGVSLFNRGSLVGQHLKVTVIGEELAKRMNFRNMLGYLLRSPQIRLSSTILCAKGTAKDLLESEEKGQGSELPALQIFEIANNTKYSLRMLDPMTYGKVGRYLATQQSFLLPCITKKKDEVLFEDAAVIDGKTNRLAGFLTSEEIAGVNWITGKKGGGLLNVYNPKGHIFSAKIDHMHSKIIPRVQGDQISFDVQVKADGLLTEDWIESDDASDESLIKQLEKETEQKIVYQMRSALHKMQKVYKADVAGFGDAVRIHHPRLWQRVKNNWDDKHFSNAPIRLHIDLKLKDFGVKTRDR